MHLAGWNGDRASFDFLRAGCQAAYELDDSFLAR